MAINNVEPELPEPIREHIGHFLIEILSYFDITFNSHDLASDFSLLIATILLSLFFFFFVKHFVKLLITKLYKNQNTKIRLTVSRKKVPTKIALIIPFYIIITSIELLIGKVGFTAELINNILGALGGLFILIAIFAVVDTLLLVSLTHPIGQKFPLHGIAQFVKLFSIALAILMVTSVFMNRTPIYLLSGIGVLAGMLIFIFKETLLGFVAGIQLAANDMVTIGQWIQLDKYKINGIVQEVTLTTVKVQNWDNTISMVPSQTLMNEPFVNWYGVEQIGARRIKRCLYIDIETINFIEEQQFSSLIQIELIRPYLEKKMAQLNEYNDALSSDISCVNHRKLTNLGCFREYMARYIESHGNIRADLTLIIKQLETNNFGIPLEVYCFVNTTVLREFEQVQADIFDHFYSIMKEFNLSPVKVPINVLKEDTYQ
ncbi:MULTISPECIES: mechanosensitive ion channel family protein [Shewanella]|uniref:Mechanosensitive ion channel MscS domain-containing protein n=1 Tax=Shewanella japonica TaxID=93973 RepID=A0ABN4YL00_9GAMM|nr:mechanosensitive ion channel family protein [Shewanella japonica]ARD23125.1 hypothetical protein SJ2017_2844 [Shewanella japonica]